MNVAVIQHVNPISHLVTAAHDLMAGTATAGQIGWVLAAFAVLTAVDHGHRDVAGDVASADNRQARIDAQPDRTLITHRESV